MSGQSKSADRHRQAVDGLLVAPESRQARRELGTTAWGVLEEVALDARLDGPARTPQPGRFLRLADAGLVEPQRRRDETGAFARSVYVVHLVESSGLVLLGSDRCPAPPRDSRHTVATGATDPEGQGNDKSLPARRTSSRRGASRRRALLSEQGDLFDADSLAEQR